MKPAGNNVVLGLGTNLGDREGYLRSAIELLRDFLDIMQCSPVYECPALLPEGASEEWNHTFLNMAVMGETTLSPQSLLTQAKAIEQALGRVSRGHWGPREIDVDILAYGDIILNEPELIIPHRDLLLRDFALIPLAEIAPDWIHPVTGKKATVLAENIPSHLKKTDIVIL